MVLSFSHVTPSQGAEHSMVDFSSWHSNEEELSILPNQDPLGILSSTRTVVEQSKHVWINREYAEQLSEQWLKEDARNTNIFPPLWNDPYHFYDGTKHTVNWLLILDALNFYFWPEK